MSQTPTIRRYLVQRTLLFSALGFGLILLMASQAYQSSVRDSGKVVARSVAETTFNSMYLIMSQGWTRNQLTQFVSQLENSGSEENLRVSVLRGPVVIEKFGTIEQPAFDSAMKSAFESGEIIELMSNDHLRTLYPLQARTVCTACHTNAKVGDTLGLIEVRQNLAPQIAAANKQLLLYMLGLAPLPLLLAFWSVRTITRSVNQSLDQLTTSISQVESLQDLTGLNRLDHQFRFRELNSIFGQVSNLAGKLHSIAVDKDLLEFEIRLLEKCVITSEVVRDWREYVNALMLDINQVIQIYTMFSIFKVDEELFDLEIFWLSTPTDQSKEMMERSVIQRLRDHSHLFGYGEFKTRHNIANSSGGSLNLSEEEIDLQVKSLLVETPKIGGIVGIGVQADTIRDQTKLLVIESILSTLLNVVGSVKAIYKYTRDLEYYATRDPLTNLYNQRMFWELLDYELDRSTRHGYKTAMLLIDLDNFKAINDGYGHACGDRLLSGLSEVMHQQLETGTVLARYGGDEFVVVLPEATLEAAGELADRLLHTVQNYRLQLDNNATTSATCSIGVGIYPDHADNRKDLFMFVDNLMYRAKSMGKDRIALPHDQDLADIFRDMNEKSLLVNKAIEERSILPAFQPISPLSGGQRAVEVLSRIQLPGDQLMSAAEFIEIAESMGRIHMIDYIVTEKAFETVRRTGYDGLIFINLSPRSVLVADFLLKIRSLVKQYEIEPSRVVFEITERDTVKNMSLLEKFVQSLKDQGYQLAIDDFGSGFSSFHYLKYLPIDFVKIEGEFIANMANDQRDMAFVTSITQLAKQLNVQTVAEFVETEEVLALVKEAGIDYAQGYLIGRPGLELEGL
ncbi:bifunctional diguanylate cyclase/phosphodiesterase [Marinobacterium sp. D7]|uniref:putative bifunctional diguanylate cyclase/phosphodiesterase n=1 Tax=Marinobacterium ramblicola TaxID=2849041 RepID=UPI001C2CFC28|nr:bifunctional diguanylate cyclase/phosphodiesterase [Marinobacterium ramblicola]MBV1786732.1 bifunctional diguanylate cyclase/phosphodiesterase [Marinobacterium ramblicola]